MNILEIFPPLFYSDTKCITCIPSWLELGELYIYKKNSLWIFDKFKRKIWFQCQDDNWDQITCITIGFFFISPGGRFGYSQGCDWPGRVTWCSFTPSNNSSAPPLDREATRVSEENLCSTKMSLICFGGLITLTCYESNSSVDATISFK